MRKISAILFIILMYPIGIFPQDQSTPTGNINIDRAETGFNISDTDIAFTDRAALAMTTPEYMVTPGDIYTLTFVSSVGVQELTLFVDYNYNIDISNLGIVNGRGRTYIDVEQQIEEIVARTYPLSAPKLIIKSTGTFPVFITGEVKNAGQFYTWGLGRLSELIPKHMTKYGSIRDLKITDFAGNTTSYDLFNARRTGDLDQDPYLKPWDRIHVSRMLKQVTLSGAVYREGQYQLLKGDTLGDLITVYGDGLLETADPMKIRVLRSVGGKESVGERFELTLNEAKEFTLKNFDRVSIPLLQDFLPVVFFEGAVKQGGDEINIDLSVSQRIPYYFYPGETIADASRSIRGQFSQVSNLEEAYIRRGSSTIAVDISKYLYDSEFTNDIELMANDTVVVPFRQFFVTVSGAVPSPGRYPYVPDRSWQYYVNLAGGIDPVRNSGDKFTVTDKEDESILDIDDIPPEAKIDVNTNSFLFYFNQYAPVITTVLGLVSTTIGILATTNNL